MNLFDLRDETITSSILDNFQADPILICHKEDNAGQITSYNLQRDLDLDQLELLYDFLKTPSSVQPPQLDIISTQRLCEIQMTLADADLILKRFNQRTGFLGEEVDATDLNYLALKDATEFFLSKEEGITAFHNNKKLSEKEK